MDKQSKKFLKHFASKENAGQYICLYQYQDHEKEAEKLNLSVDEFNDIVKHLESLGYLEFVRYHGTDRHAGFKLTHKGLHHRNFQLQEIKKYISDKWIDFAALIASIIALILSYIALLSK